MNDYQKSCNTCAYISRNSNTEPCNNCSICYREKPNSQWQEIALIPVHFVSKEQPAPTPNSNPAIWACVIQDMAARDILGASRYGTRLQASNGRDMLQDAYEEALDLACYLRGAIFERDGK